MLKRYNPKSVEADIAIMSLSDEVFVEILGFEATNIPDLESSVGIDKLLYETVWQPEETCFPNLGIWQDHFSHECLQQSQPDEYAAVCKVSSFTSELSAISSVYMREALKTIEGKNVYAGFTRYINCLRKTLEAHPTSLNLEEASHLISELTLQCPEFAYELNQIQLLGKMLPDTLINPKPTIQFLYGYDSIANYFIDALSTRFYYKVCSDVIGQSVREALRHKAVVRILEIGARMGGLTKYILDSCYDELSNGRVEYVFTDLNTTFFQRAKKYLSDYPPFSL